MLPLHPIKDKGGGHSMKVTHRPDDDEIRQRRRAAYLEAWPVEDQLEAITEAYAGRVEKFAQLVADFSAIKDIFPKNKGGATDA